jgi:beta-glucosidase
MDIYIEPFYRPIHEAKVGGVMAAYNAVNNTYCSENKILLTDILRGILDFKGFVMSDWWSVYSNHSDSFNSGLDLNMPGGYAPGPFDEAHKYDNFGRNHSYWTPLEDYVKNKTVEEKRVNESARRIIATMYQLNQMENYPKVDLYKETKTEERKNLQRKAATESQVLLKNDGILPLKNIKKNCCRR